MKKTIILSIAFLLCLQNQSVLASTMSNPANNTSIIENKAEKERATFLLTRLKTIKEMDKTQLTSKEIKTLRKEVNTINKELVKTNGGIYLSVGAVLLVILLLILLL